MQTITNLVVSIINFINNVAVPLIFAVAFVVFLFGVFRYFIAGGANPEKRKEGRQLIIYSIIGFAVMICVWGLVNLVVNSFALDKTRPALPTFNSAGSGTGTTNSLTVPSSGTGNNP